MTKRDTLLKLFAGNNDSNTIPLVGWCDPWAQPGRDNMPPELAEKLSDIQWGDERNLHFCRHLDLSVFDWHNLPVKATVPDTVSEKKHEGDNVITLQRTPYGELKSIVRTIPGSPAYTVKHMIETEKDLEVWIQQVQSIEFELDKEQVSLLAERKKAIGDDGILLCSLPGSPLGMMIRGAAGVENTVMLSFDAPELVEEYTRVVRDSHLRQVAAAIHCDMDGIINIDDTSTSTQNPKMFEDYTVGYTNALADVLHKDNKFYIHHSCGLIKGLLPVYNQLRINGVHAYSLNPVGDCEIKDREILRDDIAIIVSLNSAIEHLADKKDVATKIKEMFEEAASQKNVCFQFGARQQWDMERHSFIINECKKGVQRNCK